MAKRLLRFCCLSPFRWLLIVAYALSVWCCYQLMDYVPVQRWTYEESYCGVIRVSQDNQLALVRSHDWLAVVEVASGKNRWVQRFEKAHVYPQFTSECMSPDGNYVSYRRCNHNAECDPCYLIHINSGTVVTQFAIDDYSWGKQRLLFSSDSRTAVFQKTNQKDKRAWPHQNEIVVWDLAAQQTRLIVQNNDRSSYRLLPGNVLACLNPVQHQVEFWDIKPGTKLKTITISNRNSADDDLWLNLDGSKLFIVGTFSRSEQLNESFKAGMIVVECLAHECTAPMACPFTRLPYDDDLGRHLEWYLGRARYTEQSVECYDIATGKLISSKLMPYPVSVHSGRYLVRRAPPQSTQPEAEQTHPVKGPSTQYMLEVYDLEQNVRLMLVPGGGTSHQIDLLPRNVFSFEECSVDVLRQHSAVLVEMRDISEPTPWAKLQYWLGEWLPAFKSTVTNTDVEYQYDLYFHRPGSNSVTTLKHREFCYLSDDGTLLATRRTSNKTEIIELWNWPMHKPWLRIFGWPVVVIPAFLFLRWLLQRPRRIVSSAKTPSQ